MNLTFDLTSVSDYRRFLAVKRLPIYRIRGHSAWFPDEYANRIGVTLEQAASTPYAAGVGKLFDYQRDITAIAVRKKKFAIFADCGLGKTMMFLEYVRHVYNNELPSDKRLLIVSPLMVVKQTMDEAQRWYGKLLPIERVEAKELSGWLTH